MPKSLDHYTKQDWIDANIHGAINRDTVIYRIFRIVYLLKDLQDKTNTLVNPCYETQGDDLENPLKNAKFRFEGGKYELFKSLMSEYYTQSWSLENNTWSAFGDGHDTIRIHCKAGVLFDRLMDEADPFYSLYYHMGLISYEDPNVIRNEVSYADFGDYLDSLGYGLLKTVIRIAKKFHREKEVRLVYIRSPRGEYSYPNRNSVFGDQHQFCAHRFDWSHLIDGYEFNPQNRSDGKAISEVIDKIKNGG